MTGRLEAMASIAASGIPSTSLDSDTTSAQFMRSATSERSPRICRPSLADSAAPGRVEQRAASRDHAADSWLAAMCAFDGFDEHVRTFLRSERSHEQHDDVVLA